MHLYTEAIWIAREALEIAEGDFDEARDTLQEVCESHEVAIYYGKAIQFCADNDTSEGEDWLDDCGGIVQPGDTFGGIACRIAFATLYCAALDVLGEIESESEGEEV